MKGVKAFIEPGFRRIFSYYPGWISAYDLDTLTPRGAGRSFAGVGTVAVTDPATGTLFAGFVQTGVGGTVRLDQFTSAPAGVELVSSLDLTPFLSQKQIVGMATLPGSKRMWLISERVGRTTGYQATGGVTITELSLNDFGQPPVHAWSTELPDCFSPMRTTEYVNAAIGYVPAHNALYFGCGNGKPPLGVQAPVRRGVGSLKLSGDPRGGATSAPTTADFTIFARDGDYAVADSFFDPGSSRMLFTSLATGGSTALVFDATTNLYIGGIATGSGKVKQPGFDPTIGRFYAGTPGLGILVTDVAATPISQGSSYPEFSGSPSEPIAESPMAIDPVTRRLFVKFDGPEVFRVVHDSLPAYVAPPQSDVDANTMDIEEAPGVTRSTFSASVQGYGSRLRQVGGVASLVINYANLDTRQYGVEGGTREYKAAYLEQLKVTNGEASAAAVSLDRDLQNTQGDLEKTKPDDESEPVADWPVDGAACFDFGGQPKDAVTVDDSVVSCDADNQRADASSESQPLSVAALLSVDAGEVVSGSRLDPARGIVATVRSTARGVSVLGGALRIGNVETRAEASAKGRPGTAASDFVRSVRDVRLNGAALCSDTCDTVKLAEQINGAFAGRVHVAFPNPDPSSRASKGGYQALVRRSPTEHTQEIVLNEQPADRIEVPGMVITIFQDASRPSRTILELAAVETEARYGISTSGVDPDIGGGGGGITGPLFGLNPLDTPYFGPPGSSGGGSGGNSPAVSLPRGGGVLNDPGRLIWNGLKNALRLMPIWAALLTPIYLSARRWLLLQRASLNSGGTR